jgi:hypothetical protein
MPVSRSSCTAGGLSNRGTTTYSVYLSMGLEWNRVHCYCGHLLGLMYQAWMVDDCGAISGMYKWQGKLKNSEKPCRNAIVSTTIAT